MPDLPVMDWFVGWFREHKARVPRHDWPRGEDGRPYWRAVHDALEEEGCTLEIATEASRRVAKAPPTHLQDQLAALLREVRAVKAERRAAKAAPRVEPPPAPDPLDEEAERVWASLDEPARDRWRSLALGAMPFLERYPTSLDRVAKAWCLDGSRAPP